MHWKPKFIILQRTLLILKIKNPDLFIILLLFHNSFHYFSFIFKRTHLESMATKYFFFHCCWVGALTVVCITIFMTNFHYHQTLCLILIFMSDTRQWWVLLESLALSDQTTNFFLHEQNLRFNRWNCIFFCSWWPMTCSYGKISTVVLCKAIWTTFSNKLI